MAYREINLDPETRGNFSQRTILDGREFVLTFRWNQREAKWYLSIADAEEAPIVQGVKIVINFPLLTSRIVDERRPPGDLFAIDPSGDSSDPGLNDLGARVRLLYIEAADIPAALPDSSEDYFELGQVVAVQTLAADALAGATTVRPSSMTGIDSGYPWPCLIGNILHEYETAIAIGKLTGPDRIVLASPLSATYTTGGGNSIVRGDGSG